MHDDTPIENLLRRRQASPEPVGGPVCGDPELLAAYAEGALSAAERERIEAHLAICGACQEAVVRLVRMAPQESAAARPAEGVAERRPEKGWLRWRWAVPALASMALVGSFVYYEHERIAGMRPNDTVSVSAPAPRTDAPQTAAEPAPPVPTPTSPVAEEALRKQPASTVGSKLGKTEMADAQKKADTVQPPAAPPAAAAPARTELERSKGQVFQAQNQAPGGAPMQQAMPQPAAPMPPPPAAKPQAMDEIGVSRAEAGPRRQAARPDEPAKGKEESKDQKAGGGVVGGIAAGRARDANELRMAAAAAFRREVTADDKRFALTTSGRMMFAEEDRAAQWQPLNVPTNATVIDFAAVGTHLWVLLPNGRVGHSSDSGATWGPPIETGASDAISIRFTDAKNGEIRTRGGKRLRTTDGGETWKPE